MPNNMNQDEFLAAIADAVKRKQAGEDPEMDPRARAMILRQRSAKGWNMPIEPAKPDPEAAANLQVQRAVNRPAGAGNVPSPQELGEMSGQLDNILGVKPAPKQINPETGMPYFGEAPQVSPEDAQKRQEMQMRMEFLRRRSQGQ